MISFLTRLFLPRPKPLLPNSRLETFRELLRKSEKVS